MALIIKVPQQGLWVLAASLLLAGCASPAASDIREEIDLSGVSAEQATELADDSVSQDEYRAAFQRFSACVSASGYELLINGETNLTIDYAIPDAAVVAGIDQECYSKEFQQVDMLWQIAHEDTSESTQYLRDCLVSRGIAPKETTKEIGEQLREAGISPGDCS